MAVSTKFSNRCQVKSISLPSRSHPTTIRIEQQLDTAATAASVAASKPSVENICSGLSHLTELYKCMNDLLNLSATQVLISHQQNKKWVEELIDESVIFLDVCGSIRDMLIGVKERIIDLQCALRRAKGNSNVENSITKYNCFRKKMMKDVKLLVGSLKQVDNMIIGDTDHGLVVVDSDNHHLAAVIKAVIGVTEMTASFLESLLMFFSMPITKPNKWSLVVSKLMHKGMVECEEQEGTLSEFESIDDALQTLRKYESSTQSETMGIVKCRLERLEAQLQCIETKLECLFRHLLKNRATLLNIIT